MLIKEYAEFVRSTDQFSGVNIEESRKIAIYGLVSEIGSVVSAVKKHALQESGALSSPLARSELKEELGDAMWYAFALARIEGLDGSRNILLLNIKNLLGEISKDGSRGDRIRSALTDDEVSAFSEGALAFGQNPSLKISDYQNVAYLTARTHGEVLLDVCAAVLTQLGAQLMRHQLPAVELDLNKQVEDSSIEVVLSAIAWHLCAVASLYYLNMDEVAAFNHEKVKARIKDDRHTPLHDHGAPEAEQLPREICVEFRTMENGTSQMFWDGKELGAPLRDQYSIADGYRFHDVLHLANAAYLGWSPVLRDLMGIKRVSSPETKQAQDGGRSAVMEELVVKLIHWEASRRAKELHPDLPAEDRILFADGEDIPFSLLKQVRAVTEGHEVYDNKYWEWELAIRQGYRVFQQLKTNKAGFVRANLHERRLEYSETTFT